ncbi:MAG: hypothetical protein HC846_11765 [Blastocatellia bacterium]|nr:hypothetical protein [Blastocatellia bacterium]
MNKFTNPLNNIKIASPCSADWNEMIGNDQKRFCGSCQKNVYNLSEMTKDEAENLLIDSEGRLCVRFYKRADGTILTQDCPVGWAAFKRRVSKTAAAFASLIFGVIGGLGVNALFNKSEESELMGAVAYQPTPKKKSPKPKPSPTFDGATMGAPVQINPTPTPKENPIMGEMIAPIPEATPKKKDLKLTIKKVIKNQI